MSNLTSDVIGQKNIFFGSHTDCISTCTCHISLAQQMQAQLFGLNPGDQGHGATRLTPA